MVETCTRSQIFSTHPCRTAPAEIQRRGLTFGADGGSTTLQSQIRGSSSQFCGPKGTLSTRKPAKRPNTNINAANTNRCKKHLAVWATESLRRVELTTLPSATVGVASSSQTALCSLNSTPLHSTRMELLTRVTPSSPSHSTRTEYVKTVGFASHAMPSSAPVFRGAANQTFTEALHPRPPN